MAQNDEIERVDEDSLGHLEEVRKGKPRKFVMITKGATIVSLVVYKKGNLEKYTKQAKEAGRGNICYGVIEGRGPDITFKLSTADGFDKEPVKPTVLKSFLDETADYKAKPSFEIVPALGPVLDADDPLVQKFVRLQAAAKQAGVATPEKAGEFDSLCREVAARLEQDEKPEAETKIAELEKLLAPGVTADGQTVDKRPSESGTAASRVDPSQAAQLAAAFSKLTPLVKAAAAADPSRKEKLLNLVAAYQAAKDKSFNDAKRLLLEIGSLAKEMAAAAGTAASSPPAGETESAESEAESEGGLLRDEYESLHLAVEGRYLAALQAQSSRDSELRTIMTFAGERAETGDYAAGTKALRRLADKLRDAEEEIVDKVASALVDEEDEARGVVAFRKALLLWTIAQDSVRSALEQISFDVLDKHPGTDVSRLDEVLGTFDAYASLRETLIDCVNADTPEERRATRDDALDLIAEYETAINKSDAIRTVDENGFVPVAIASTLLKALRQLSAELRK